LFNNALAGTDPSGYFSLGWLDPLGSQARSVYPVLDDGARNPLDNFNLYALERSMPGRGTMDSFMLKHEWAMGLGHAALGFLSAFCGPAAGVCFGAMEAHVASYQTWLAGGSHEDAFYAAAEAGILGFIAVQANFVIGQGFNGKGPGDVFGNIFSHAVVGCAMSSAQGGDCGAGALSAAITAGVDYIQTGYWPGLALAVGAGCVGSYAGGGRCGAGAASSALVYLYNSQGFMMAPNEGVNVDAAMAGFQAQSEAGVDYSLIPDAVVTTGRNYTVSGRFRGISIVSVASYSESGVATSHYAGVGIGAGPGASASGGTSYSWGSPYGVGLRLSGTLGTGRYGASGSVFLGVDGVNITRGTAIGIARTGGNITFGIRTNAQ
jgi:Possible hemagglutinin (DUF637)